MEERIFRMNGKWINGDVAAVGVALKITIVLAKWHAANAKCSQHQLSIPFGYRYFWQRIAFSLRIGEDTFYLPKTDYNWLRIGVVLVFLGENRLDNLVGFAASQNLPTEGLPALVGSDWLASSLHPQISLVGIGVVIEARIHIAAVARHVPGRLNYFAPVDLTSLRNCLAHAPQ